MKHSLEIAQLVESGISSAKFPNKEGMLSREFILEGKFLDKDRRVIADLIRQGKNTGEKWMLRYMSHDTLAEIILKDAGMERKLTGNGGKGIKLEKTVLNYGT